MARSSLYDLHIFLNRRFWRIKFFIAKSTWLHLDDAIRCCLSVLSFRQADRGFDSDPITEVKKRAGIHRRRSQFMRQCGMRPGFRSSWPVPIGGVVCYPHNLGEAMKSNHLSANKNNTAHIMDYGGIFKKYYPVMTVIYFLERYTFSVSGL